VGYFPIIFATTEGTAKAVPSYPALSAAAISIC